MTAKLLFNYHSHTQLSDGKAVFSDYIEEALSQGFNSIGFSDHAPVPFPSSWNMNHDNLAAYLQHINDLKIAYSDRLQIYAGLEVDYFQPYHDQIYAMAGVDKLDYYIGSVHYLDFLHEGQPWCIDTSRDEFETGFNQIFHGDGRLLYRRYYEAVLQMIETWKPPVIGHLDKIKMYNHIRPFFDDHEPAYRDAVMQVLELIKQYDLFIELNMRGFYKHPERFLYPGKWILREASRMGIRLIVSSDCHRREELSAGFSEALQILKEANFRSIWFLNNKQWHEWPLE